MGAQAFVLSARLSVRLKKADQSRVQTLLVLLDGQQIVGFAFPNRLRGFSLAVQGVCGDSRPLDLELRQHRNGRRYFVALDIDFRLSDHQILVGGEGG